MSNVNFQPIFGYIDQSAATLKADISVEIRQSMGEFKTYVANLSAQVTKYHEEMLVSGHRLNRLEECATR